MGIPNTLRCAHNMASYILSGNILRLHIRRDFINDVFLVMLTNEHSK